MYIRWINLYANPVLRSFLFIRSCWSPDSSHEHERRHSRRTPNETANSNSWRRAHFLTMMDKVAKSNTECRVLGANLPSKKTLMASGARNGHLRFATRYIHKMAFWNISNGVNRHSSCGDRVMKAPASQLSYQRRLGEEATSTKRNEKTTANCSRIYCD